MKKYWKLIIAAVAFIIFMVAAGAAYTKLSKEYKPQQNLAGQEVTASSQGQETAAPQQETAATESAEETAQTKAEESYATDKAPEKPTALDFTMENAAGEEVNFLDFSGKPIVLNFWASWCGPCKSELPDFEEAYNNYAGEVEFVMVNMTDGTRETKEIAAKFWAEEGYTLPIYFDTFQEAAYTYSVYALPTSFFIDAEGTLVAGAQGMIDAETLELGISMILGEE